jgi:hypothetical protein
MPTLTAAQIGKAGELLVQLRLLQLGVDSSHMTTDAGIDLVAYYPKSKRAATIQVKTNDRPKPSGGKGKLALDWWLPESNPAELIALVDLSELRVWLFTHPEIVDNAQQRSGGRLHLYMYTDPSKSPSKDKRPVLEREFSQYLLANRAHLVEA